MNPELLNYYEAIEHASADMLDAARAGDWDQVVKLEGACVLLISQLKHAAQQPRARSRRRARRGGAQAKSRIMQRILVNDAEIRHLAEPWLQDLDNTLAGRAGRRCTEWRGAVRRTPAALNSMQRPAVSRRELRCRNIGWR